MLQLLCKRLLRNAEAIVGLVVLASTVLERKLLYCHLLVLLDELLVARIQPRFICHDGKVIMLSTLFVSGCFQKKQFSSSFDLSLN